MPSPLQPQPKLHVAIIMDGNGRWATRRGLPRTLGHRAGAEAMRRISRAAPELGVTTLTFFAFSAYNWARSPAEVDGLMRLLGDYLRARRLLRAWSRAARAGEPDRPARPAAHHPLRPAGPHRTGDRRRAAAAHPHRRRLFRPRRDRGGGGARCGRIGRRIRAAGGPGGCRRSGRGRPSDPHQAATSAFSDFLLWEKAPSPSSGLTDQMWPDFDGGGLRRRDPRRVPRPGKRTSILPEGRRPWEEVAA